MLCKLSPEELEEPGITLDDTFQLLDRLSDEKLDYIHLSLDTIWRSSIRNKEEITPLPRVLYLGLQPEWNPKVAV